MPIPNAEHAIASREKIHDYLLNRDHPDGGSKAVWFNNLGYDQSHWQTLADDLIKIAKTCDRYNTEHSQFGVKYTASGTISSADGRSLRVLTVWIVENDDPPRLITAYPDNS